MMHGGPGDLERGDKVQYPCCACGDRYMHIEKVEQDPPCDTRFCPECYPTYKKVSSALVAGKWRVRDAEFRQQMIDVIDERTDYDVWVADRVDDVYIYDPDEIVSEAFIE